MIDLKIDNKGDLELRSQPRLPRFVLEFRHADYPIFSMQFMQRQGHEKPDKPKNGFTVDFHVGDKSGLYDEAKNIHAVTGSEELKQRVIMHMRTEKGETRLASNLGSELARLKHKNLTNKRIRQEIADLIAMELEDIVGDARVVISHEKYDGPFYSQNITIRIYRGDYLIYTMTI